jgi:hypothetical protein
LVEHLLAKQDVVSSNLITRSTHYLAGVNGSMTVSKTVGRGSNPSLTAKQFAGVVLVVTHILAKDKLRVRFSPPAPNNISVV